MTVLAARWVKSMFIVNSCAATLAYRWRRGSHVSCRNWFTREYTVAMDRSQARTKKTWAFYSYAGKERGMAAGMQGMSRMSARDEHGRFGSFVSHYYTPEPPRPPAQKPVVFWW